MRKALLLSLLVVSNWPAFAETKANGLAILFTDYGHDSVYVGSIKGAMYAKNLAIKIDTLTNSVPNFDVVAGAYLLLEGCQTYPKGTTFCCVVDPGVGTERRCIVLETKSGHRFVAPDNGLLTLVAEHFGIADLRECTNKDLWLSPTISTTFQGRDIFGPVTAAIAGGVAMESVGPKLDKMVKIEITPVRVENGVIHGEVMRDDPYGNVVTTITGEHLKSAGIAKGDRIEVTVGKSTFTAPWVTTYGSVGEGERLVVLQSSGFVEFAINRGSMAEAIKEKPHAPVTLKKAAE